LLDRVDGVVERLRCDLRDLRSRSRLVDELGAAAEIETELGGLRERRPRDDHQQGQQEQPGNEREDRAVAAAVGHVAGVRTSSSPPSSSYAGKMSAVAGSGLSPSACTTTGFESTRTPHSSAVPMWSSPFWNSRPSTSR